MAENKIIIDGEGAILGRLATFVAKEALGGKEIIIFNSEKVIITGNKQNILKKYKGLRDLGGTTQKGPYFPRQPFLILKRAIRGMLPSHREGVGREAFKRVKCFEGLPKEFEKEKAMKIKVTKPEKFMDLKELAEKL